MKTNSKKVIIIGAGIAGLAACTRLLEDGIDVEILEARDRCGGRISVDTTMGLPLSCGATWIHGDLNNPMTLLADRFQVKKVPVDTSKFARFDASGNLFNDPDFSLWNQNFEKLSKDAKKLAFSETKDISLFTAMSRLILKHGYSQKEQNFFKAKQFAIEDYFGANMESLSGRYWDSEEIWPGENCFLLDTYGPIVENLAKQCKIKLNTVVKTVDATNNKVQLSTNQGNFQADAVIITVPLGALKKKKITFYPCLPAEKQNAIQNLGMGLLNILTLKFPFRFWPKEYDAMFFTEFDAPSIQTFFNLNNFIPQPILVGYCGGKTAEMLELLTDEQLIEKTMENFRKKFGSEIPDPDAYINTRWLSDPYSYGSYSYIPTGASPNDYAILSESVLDKLYFAGEATSTHYSATTHGAYLSGIREAEKIIKK